MEDRRRWGRQRKIEARRRDKESLRAYIKHYGINPLGVGTLVRKCLALLESVESWRASKDHFQLLRARTLAAKFCNGLIGVSLTLIALPAPLVN